MPPGMSSPSVSKRMWWWSEPRSRATSRPSESYILNWPASTQDDDSVGFVTRVNPGVKENASIFSHPNTWPIIAEAILGRGDRAIELYDAITPYSQNDMIEVRGAEPYAYVQFGLTRTLTVGSERLTVSKVSYGTFHEYIPVTGNVEPRTTVTEPTPICQPV